MRCLSKETFQFNRDDREKEMESRRNKPIAYRHSKCPLKLWEEDSQLQCYQCRKTSLSRDSGCGSCLSIAPDCRACGMEWWNPDDPFYYCDICRGHIRYFIHKSCSECPQEINVFVHPQHPLKYLGESRYMNRGDCDYCHGWQKSFMFGCQECGYQIHMACALKLIKYHEGREQFQHSSHLHPMVFLEKLDADISVRCQVCNLEISDPSCGCAPCGFCFHKLCFEELQQEIQHPYHPCHTLSLTDLSKLLTWERNCAVCHYPCGHGLGYSCKECVFYLHASAECAFIMPSINYENHDHLLTLLKTSFTQDCDACGYDILGPYHAACVGCMLKYHINCDTDLLPPSIEFKHHEHPLTLIMKSERIHDKDDIGKLHCGTCNKIRNPEDLFYNCAECNYSAHVHCVVSKIKTIGELKHFSHKHLLFPFCNKEDIDIDCYACSESIKTNDLAYTCRICKLYVHKSCLAEIVQEIEHPFHPHHSLVMKEHPLSSRSICKACGDDLKQITYGCDECNFHLHIECASLMPSIKYKGHEHDLALLRNGSLGYYCEACSFYIKYDSYCARCVVCDISYHVQCQCGEDSLPSTILYEHHKHSYLTLDGQSFIGKDYRCGICKKKRRHHEAFYYCNGCEYSAHVHCIVTEVQLNVKEKLRHFSHRHYLDRYENGKGDNYLFCDFCSEHIESSTLAYYCSSCNFFLHDSCFSLEKLLEHPFHPSHSLTVSMQSVSTELQCHACYKYFRGLAYSCEECNFDFDLDCISLCPSIKVPNHDHEVTFFKKLYSKPECIACKSMTLTTFYLRCVRCQYNIHIMCSPLPETLRHVSHQEHQLTLKDYFGEDEKDEYCDYCEQMIDAQECAYCCKECHFVADFNCVINEVLLSWEGERGEVKLRNRKRGLTVKELIGSLTKDEGDQYLQIQDSMLMEMDKIKIHQDSSSSKSFKSDEDFVFSFVEEEEVVVKVADYMVPKSLSTVLGKILKKYGDIAAKCNLTPTLKSLLLIRFCWTLQSMCNVTIRNVTQKQLDDWWQCLKFGQYAGLELQFAIDHLTKIAHARFGIDTEINKYAILHKIHEGKAEHFQAIDKALQTVEKIDKEIGIHIRYTESEGLREEKQGFYEFLEKII